MTRLSAFIAACTAGVLLIGGTSVAQSRTEAVVASLGRTGGTLAIRSVDDLRRPGTSRRTAVLTVANGGTRTLALNDGGGLAQNNAVNLIATDDDRFKLLSERDCVDVDPLHAQMTVCPVREPCRLQPGETYVGRWDWMNGFDPPNARFTFRFRFLPSFDALCSV